MFLYRNICLQKSHVVVVSPVSNIESDNSQNFGLEDYNNISDGIFPHFTTLSIKITSCPIHVVTFTLISNLATDYIQKRTGQALLFSFEYNLSPNLISK